MIVIKKGVFLNRLISPSAVQNKVLERENAELRRRLQASGEVGYVSGYEPTVTPQNTYISMFNHTHKSTNISEV